MIYHGDLFVVLPTLTAESIDACVTDPPYGIGFMGKEWDTFSPDVANKKHGLRQINKSEVWSEREARKQAKYQINPNLKGRTVDGAISSSQIAYDFSVAGLRGFQAWCEQWAREVFRVLKPGAHILVCGAPRSYHRMACGLEDAGFEIRDSLSWLFGQGFPKSLNIGDGRGTGLKPAHEPIVLARKPLSNTVAKNVLQYGTGALNIDACRIGTDETWAREPGTVQANSSIGTFQTGVRSVVQNTKGRWPANVLLDEEAAKLLDAQTGELTSGAMTHEVDGYPGESVTDFLRGRSGPSNQHGDSGGASRFFYVAKPSRGERDDGCYDLQAHTTVETVQRRADSAGAQNPRAGAGRGAGAPIYGCAKCGLNLQGGRAVTRCDDGGEHERVIVGYGAGARNIHPTVKPIELMEYLIKLIVPPDGTVLDPFLGSGTTGCAARYQDRKFIGIEKEAIYVEIAQRRITEINPLIFGEEEIKQVTVTPPMLELPQPIEQQPPQDDGGFLVNGLHPDPMYPVIGSKDFPNDDDIEEF